jgi:hypothetical protein
MLKTKKHYLSKISFQKILYDKLKNPNFSLLNNIASFKRKKYIFRKICKYSVYQIKPIHNI